MSVTLREVWKASPEDLEAILNTEGRTSSDKPGLNRAAVAIIYYNAGMLDDKDRKWLEWPGFVEAMSSTSSLTEGFKALKRPFIVLLLTLYASGNITWGAIAEPVSNNTGDVDKDATFKAADVAVGRDIWRINRLVESVVGTHAESEIVFDSSEKAHPLQSIVRTVVRDAVRDPKATPGSVAKAAAEMVWRITLEKQPEIRAFVENIAYKNKAFRPDEIVNKLLHIDLSKAIPKARCYHLYMISRMLQVIPPNANLSEELNNTIQKYGCDIILEHEPTEPFTARGLSPLTSKIGEDTEKNLRALIGRLIGRPPTEEEVMQRLLHL